MLALAGAYDRRIAKAPSNWKKRNLWTNSMRFNV